MWTSFWRKSNGVSIELDIVGLCSLRRHHGIHFDNYREMWSYRDWVIDAFNRNLPFDQFTVEQLAGDLLPNPTMDQRIATVFIDATSRPTKVGSSMKSMSFFTLVIAPRRQLRFGLTANCAVCHDHKFDPITARDFYSMSAFFNNTTQDLAMETRRILHRSFLFLVVRIERVFKSFQH